MWDFDLGWELEIRPSIMCDVLFCLFVWGSQNFSPQFPSAARVSKLCPTYSPFLAQFSFSVSRLLGTVPLHYYRGYCDHKMQTALPVSSSPSVMCPANREKSIFHFLPFISDYSLFDLVVSNISEKLILVEQSPEDGHKTLLCKTSRFLSRKVSTGGKTLRDLFENIKT